MLIIGDEKRHTGFPWMTVLLVLLNVAGFVAQVVIGDRVTYGYSTVPVEVQTGEDLVGVTLHEVRPPGAGPVVHSDRTPLVPHQPGPRPIHLTLVTGLFLHAGLLHLAGNMAFLLVFGRNVERAMGAPMFLAFYLVCGVEAAVVHVCVAPYSALPLLGASGAISGVIGAYVFLYPFIWMKVWVVLDVVELPAVLVVGGWVLLQVVNMFSALDAGVTAGVAYWVHVGGFVIGVVFVVVLRTAIRILYALTPRPRRGGPPGRPRTYRAV